MSGQEHITIRLTKPGLFPLGKVAVTRGILEELGPAKVGEVVGQLLARHVTGDWGELEQTDRDENARAIPLRLRILSAYTVTVHVDGRGAVDVRVWVITEADRSVTTLLLPDEY